MANRNRNGIAFSGYGRNYRGSWLMTPIKDIDGDGKVDQADIDLQQASDAHDKQETQIGR